MIEFVDLTIRKNRAIVSMFENIIPSDDILIYDHIEYSKYDNISRLLGNNLVKHHNLVYVHYGFDGTLSSRMVSSARAKKTYIAYKLGNIGLLVTKKNTNKQANNSW